MGTSPDTGVVDHTGAVFGYEELYVADGSIIPRALGVNPSRTIGALAERIADGIVKEADARQLKLTTGLLAAPSSKNEALPGPN